MFIYGPRCEFELVRFDRNGIEMGDQRLAPVVESPERNLQSIDRQSSACP